MKKGPALYSGTRTVSAVMGLSELIVGRDSMAAMTVTTRGLLTSQEDRRGARKVLTAAGLTYLAAAVTSVLQLLYYVSIIKRNQ